MSTIKIVDIRISIEARDTIKLFVDSQQDQSLPFLGLEVEKADQQRILIEFSNVYQSSYLPDYFPLNWKNDQRRQEWTGQKMPTVYQIEDANWVQKEELNFWPNADKNDLRYNLEALKHYVIKLPQFLLQVLAEQINITLPFNP